MKDWIRKVYDSYDELSEDIQMNTACKKIIAEFFNPVFADAMGMRIDEILAHHVDPVHDSLTYFKRELTEPNHKNILKELIADEGIVTRSLVIQWIDEERKEKLLE